MVCCNLHLFVFLLLSLYIYLSVFPHSRYVLCLSSLQYSESGVLVLLLRLAQEPYKQNPEELVIILDLLSRLVTFNMVFYILVAFIAECVADIVHILKSMLSKDYMLP